MSAKVIVEKQIFLKYPAVFLEVEVLCINVKVEASAVTLQPKSGYLVPVLVVLTKAHIPYTLHYEESDESDREEISKPEDVAEQKKPNP